MVEPILSGPDEPSARRPLLGYAMVLAATCMWGVNGAVSKGILGAGLSSPRLTEVRSTGAAIALAVALVLTQPWRLRVRRDELVFLCAFGIFGLALVQWFYFFAIHRLEIGIALLIQYLAPLGIGLYAPCMILVSLLGMAPTAAFPIMMGSCAFLMPLSSVRFVRTRTYDVRAALGLALGGFPAVLIAAYVVQSMSLDAVRWLVVVVVIYTSANMLMTARAEAAVPNA